MITYQQLELICHHIVLYKMHGIVIQSFIYFIFRACKFKVAHIHKQHWKHVSLEIRRYLTLGKILNMRMTFYCSLRTIKASVPMGILMGA